MNAQLDIFAPVMGYAKGLPKPGLYTERRPTPPGEWVCLKEQRIDKCPRCNNSWHVRFVEYFYADRGAQALYERAGINAQAEDGNTLARHWSKMTLERCEACGLKIAHDNGGNIWTRAPRASGLHVAASWWYHEPFEEKR